MKCVALLAVGAIASLEDSTMLSLTMDQEVETLAVQNAADRTRLTMTMDSEEAESKKTKREEFRQRVENFASSMMGTKLDNDTVATLELFKEDIEDMVVELQNESTTSQTELDDKAADCDLCQTWHTFYETSAVVAAEGAATASRNAHSQCRTQQALLVDPLETKWNAVVLAKNGFDAPVEDDLANPTPLAEEGGYRVWGLTAGDSDAYELWLNSSIAAFETQRNSITSVVGLYENAHTAYTNKNTNCSDDLEAFELDQCSLTDTVCVLCDTYDDCYDTRSAAYNTAEGLIQEREPHLEVELRSFRNVLCLLDVLINSDNDDHTVRQSDLQACKDENHTVQPIDYPGIHERVTCVKKESSEFPCNPTFEALEYVNNNMFGHDDYECTACSGTCTKVEPVVT